MRTAYVAREWEASEIEAYFKAKNIPPVQAMLFVLQRDDQDNLIGVLPVNFAYLAGPVVGDGKQPLLEALDQHFINTLAGYEKEYLFLDGQKIVYRQVPEKVGV